MPISNALQNVLNDTYMNPAVAAEHVQALNGATPARLVTAAGQINGQTDNRLLLNASAGATALALPAGVDGMTFRISKAAADAATWSLTPNGSNVIDGSVTTALALGAGHPFSVHHLGGTWYAM